MSENARLLLVGCGKMGGALLRGWLQAGFNAANIRIVEPMANAAKRFSDAPALAFYTSAQDLPDDFLPDAVILAVKPQMMAEAVPAFSRYVASDAVFVSIAAGQTLANFSQLLGSKAALLRAMPNTPAAVGRGITAVVANDQASKPQRMLGERLLEAAGKVVWLEIEAQMDAVTAVSGSGPAYVFYMVECLTKAGLAQGLPADIASQLARETVTGSGELLHQSDESATVLRQNVTSPGGTTAAALEVLMADDGLAELMARVIEAAARRSEELSS